MKLKRKSDEGNVDYVAAAGLQCPIFNAFVLHHYWGIDVNLRHTLCKASIQVGRHAARSYRKTRSLMGPIACTHTIIFFCRKLTRIDFAIICYDECLFLTHTAY